MTSRVLFAFFLSVVALGLVSFGFAEPRVRVEDDEMRSALSSAGASAESFLVEVWDTDLGLPHSTVTSIVQTPDGYLWVSTLHGGLARFDGVRFVHFNPNNTPELKSHSVLKLLVDAQGTLWAAMADQSLVSYAGGRFRREYHGAPSPLNWPAKLVSSGLGGLAFATAKGGLIRCQRRDGAGEWDAIQPADMDGASSPCEDRQGTIWYRTKEARLGQIRGGDAACVTNPPGLQGQQINTLATDADGGLWVGTDKELARWNGRQFSDMTPTNDVRGFGIQRIVACADGTLWVRTERGLRKCSGRAWTSAWNSSGEALNAVSLFSDSKGGLWLVHYGAFLGRLDACGQLSFVWEEDGLPNRQVECWFEDREGNVWVGLTSGGLARVRGRMFHKVWGEQSPFKASCSICEDRGGTMWFSTFTADQGILLASRDGVLTNFPMVVEGETWLDATLAAHADAHLWLGSPGSGVAVFENGVFRRPFQPGEAGTAVWATHADNLGRLWLGIGNDFFCWERGLLRRFTFGDGFPEQPLQLGAIAEDATGALWLGTGDGELRRYRDGKFTVYRPQDTPADMRMFIAAGADSTLQPRGFGMRPERFFRTVCADAEGVVWIGTLGGGLLRFQDGVFTRYMPRDGLPCEYVCQILDDGRGQLWLGTLETRGCISRVSKADLNRFARGELRFVPFVTYGPVDGLPLAQCSSSQASASCRSRDGRLWFSTVKGAVWIDPAAVRFNAFPPPVVIEEILVNSRPYTEFSRQPRAVPIRIAAGKKKHLKFKFTALSFTSPDKVRFKWRLAGLEEAWSPESCRRSVGYSFVPPGHYEFHVQACNNDGVWNECGASAALTVLPFYWQTWWFKTAVVAAGLACLLGTLLTVQRRRYHVRLRALERQHALEQERTRIARDIHDQVGANLTKIGKLAEFLDRQSAVAEPHRAALQTVAETTRNMVLIMDEIVWAVNPRNDTLNNVANYLVYYAEEFLGHVDVGCELEVPFEFPPVPVSAEVRHNLFMAAKEALNNAVKHSHPARIRLCLAATGARLELSFEDDGCGFDPAIKPAGRNGLENMRRRIESVGGAFHLDSAPGHGTRVHFDVPIGDV